MSDPAFALQAAVHARLSADAPLAAMIGDGGIHDAPPRAAALPFVALGSWRVRPVAAGGEPAHEHRFQLLVRTDGGGRKQASAIADRVGAAMTDTALEPDGHRVATLALVERSTSEARDRRSFEALLVFRAVTEPQG